jgi:hypothetical protein
MKMAQQFIAGYRGTVQKSVKRTTEVFPWNLAGTENLNRPFHGLASFSPVPSHELLGYFHRVRCTDAWTFYISSVRESWRAAHFSRFSGPTDVFP